MFLTSSLSIPMTSCRIPARRYEYFLVLFFATDEINRNPHLLSNMSFFFSINSGTCEDTLGYIEELNSRRNISLDFLNYDCAMWPTCNVELTGPSWTTSLKLAILSRNPKVRMCDIE